MASAKRRIRYPYQFDPAKRKLSRAYGRGRIMSFLVQGVIIPIAFFSLFVLTGFNSALAAALPYPLLAQAAAFYTVLYAMLSAVYLPANFYFSYVYEHKFKLSNYTKRAWAKDHAKFSAFGYFISLPVIVGLYALLPLQNWWIFAAFGYFALEIAFNYAFPELFLPLFYKLTPYRDKTHMKRLIAIADQAGVSNVDNVLVADESVRSKKANAFFSGFGRTKHIVLFDTLLANFTKDETETVLGHEAGHYVNKDIWKGIFADFIKMAAALFVINLVLTTFGVAIAAVAAFPLIMLMYNVIDLLAMPLENAYSRRIERRADEFALDVVKKPEAQISTEKRLADMHLSELSPHWLVEKWLYSHPKVTDRIQTAADWKKRRKN